MEKNDKVGQILNQAKGIVPKHCDNCGNKYSQSDFSLMNESSQQTTIHIKCHNCNNSYVLNVYNPVAGLIGSSRSHLNLDISDSEELMKFAGSDAISRDQALDAYSLIAKTTMLELYIKSLQKQPNQEES